MTRLLLALWIVGADNVSTLTMDQAVQLAAENNIDMRIAVERMEKASLLSKKAWTYVLPVIRSSASINYFHPEVELPFGVPEELRPLFTSLGQPFPEPQIITIQQQVQKSANVNFEWTLLSGRSLPLINAAYNMVDVEQLTFEQTKNAIAHMTRLAYLRRVATLRESEIRERSLEIAERNEKLVRARFEMGGVSESEKLSAEVAAATAASDLVAAQNAEKLAHLSLATLIGWVDHGKARDFQVQPPTVALTPRLSFDHAEPKRLDLKIAKLQIEIAESMETQNWMRFMPALVATGSWDWNENPGFLGQQTTWRLGLSLRWTVFEGGLRLWESLEAGHDATLAQLAFEKAQRALGEQIEQARLDVQLAQESLKVAEKRAKLAARASRLVQRRFELGGASQLELLEAQRAASDAESGRVLSELSLQLAYLNAAYVLENPAF